jgi:hypothetical protein
MRRKSAVNITRVLGLGIAVEGLRDRGYQGTVRVSSQKTTSIYAEEGF